MKLKKLVLLLTSYCIAAFLGFAGGIFSLPILTAPESPTEQQLQRAESRALYRGQFTKELKGSDFLHWGEGQVFLSQEQISFRGKLFPGPNYKLYLSPIFVDSEQEFHKFKDSMAIVGDVNTFNHFIVHTPNELDISNYNSVVVWCESFAEFITSAKYK